MSDEVGRFKTLLTYHGSDISRWPEDAKKHVLSMQEQAEMLRREHCFEQLLLKRGVPPVAQDLVGRIIAAASARAQSSGARSWFAALFDDVRPAAFAAMLALGFIIGFDMLALPAGGAASISAPLAQDDEGAIL